MTNQDQKLPAGHGGILRTAEQLPLPPKNLQRLDGIQMLRAVAVAIVAWLHAGQIVGALGYPKRLPNLGISGVDLFFVISGFILCLLTLRDRHGVPGGHSASAFLQRRIARIFPVYWIFASLDFARHLHHGWGEFHHYIPAVFLLPSWSQPPHLFLLANLSWTLLFEFFFYLVLACTLLFTVRHAVQWIIAIMILLVGAGLALPTDRPILVVTCNPMLLEFVFGALIALLYSKIGSGHRALGAILIASGACLALLLSAADPAWIAPYQNQILSTSGVLARALTWGTACALVVAGTVLWAPALESLFGRMLVTLGNASYSTYLLSGWVLIRMMPEAWFLQKITPGAGKTTFSAALIATEIVIELLVLGLLFYFAIERPLIRASYRLLSGRSRRTAPSGSHQSS